MGGCGRSGEVTAPAPTSPVIETPMTGVYVGAGENGMVELTISTAPAAPETTVTAFGTLSRDGGGTANLAGTYDTATDSLHLSGSGYTLAGLYLAGAAPPRLSGSFSGSLGSGFFVALVGARSSVRSFCATYENSGATLWGTIDLTVSSSSVAGFEVLDGDTFVVALAGSVSGTGTTRTVAFAGNPFVGSGTWNTSTRHVEGTWTADAQSGVWSGDECLAGTTSQNSPRARSRASRGRASGGL